MATIVVEDGTGKTDANSYVSEAELSTYATDRGVTISGAASVLLIQAMDYIEQQPFQGEKHTETQALQWPRAWVVIDGFAVNSDEIPQLLKDCVCEAAIAIDGGTNPLANESRATKMEKVGDIAVEYTDTARNVTYLKALETKLTKLLRKGSGGMSAWVVRG